MSCGVAKKNMTKNKQIVSVLLAMAMLAGSAISAQAAGHGMKGYKMMGAKKMTKEEMTKKHEEMKAKQASIDKALADNNYTAWVALVGADSEMAKKINVSNFPKLVEAYNLRKQLEAKMTELGLGGGAGLMMGGMGWDKPCNKIK